MSAKQSLTQLANKLKEKTQELLAQQSNIAEANASRERYQELAFETRLDQLCSHYEERIRLAETKTKDLQRNVVSLAQELADTKNKLADKEALKQSQFQAIVFVEDENPSLQEQIILDYPAEVPRPNPSTIKSQQPSHMVMLPNLPEIPSPSHKPTLQPPQQPLTNEQRRKDLVKEFEDLQAKLSEVSDLNNELRVRISRLEEQKKKDFLHLSNQQKLAAVQRSQIKELEKELNLLQVKLNNRDQELQQIKAERQALRNQQQSLNLQSEAVEWRRTEDEKEMSVEREKLLQENEALKLKIKTLEAEQAFSLQQNLHKAEALEKQRERQERAKAMQITSKASDLQEARGQLRAEKESREKLLAKLTTVQKEILTLENEKMRILGDHAQELQSLRQQLLQKEKQNRNLREEHLQSIQAMEQNFQRLRNENDTRIFEFKNLTDTLNNQLRDLELKKEKKIKEFCIENQSLVEKLKLNEAAAREMDSLISQLKAELASKRPPIRVDVETQSEPTHIKDLLGRVFESKRKRIINGQEPNHSYDALREYLKQKVDELYESYCTQMLNTAHLIRPSPPALVHPRQPFHRQ